MQPILIRILIFPFYFMSFLYPNAVKKTSNKEADIAIPALIEKCESRQLYEEMSLGDQVNYTAFELAITGYNKLKMAGKGIITLIDYSKPSSEKRLYVLDVIHKKLLFSSYVSHGRNSGSLFATSFSNDQNSYKSSLGFFLTENTYQGKNGYSLVLNGLEKGINDKAKARAIVIHGAPYCNPDVITSCGRLGRSLGCPALPESVSKTIINEIKGGTLLYIYANDPNYLKQSHGNL